jgi:hypothetical protein
VAGGSTFSGKVTDTTGTTIPHAQVSVKNVSTGIILDVSASTDGLYSMPNLLPGNYQVSVSGPGFATLVRTSITLTGGSQQVLNFSLRVGQMYERMEVTGEAPTVDLPHQAIE